MNKTDNRNELIRKFRQEAIDFALRELAAKAVRAESLKAEAVEAQPDQTILQSKPMPIEIVAIKRPPRPDVQLDVAAAKPTAKKSGSQIENLKKQSVEKLPQSSPTSKPATVTHTTNAKAKKQPKLR
jgi:hypothetical protein